MRGLKMTSVYVPAIAAALGTTPAQGQMAGEVLWRFEMATPFSGDEVAVGPDGTIYASDNSTLYAFNPDGTVKWTRLGMGGGTPISFLTDGAIVVGLGENVWALETDGTTRWEFSYDSKNFQEQIEVGPSVGPDGNIYAITSVDADEDVGLGAFSLTPDGDLRWSDQGQPLIDTINAGTGGPVYFTSERLIFPFKISADGGPRVYGYDFDGDQTLYVDFTCTGWPRTDPFDRVLITSACGIEAIEQDGNETYWTIDFGPVNLVPAVGHSGRVYSGAWLGHLGAISPDGTVLWTSTGVDDAGQVLAAREDVERVIFSGGGFGVPNGVGAVDASTGQLLWMTPLMQINGHNELMWTSRAATSADGTVVYFSTRFTSNAEPGAVYAVRVVEAGCPADFNADGQLNILDFLAFQNAFVQQDPKADCDVNGAFNILDFLCFQDLFQGGCP